jgi:hypothetical protein
MKKLSVAILGVMILSITPVQAMDVNPYTGFKPSTRTNYPAIGEWPEGTKYFTNSKGQACARYWKITKCW